MAGAGTHLKIADATIRTHSCTDQFHTLLSDSVCRNAFNYGSIAPDMGYFPGGMALISDVSHYIKTGQLCECLMNKSHTPELKAFSFGWRLHVTTDIATHPIVNSLVAENLYKLERNYYTYADDPIGHIQVETGLDALAWGNEDIQLPIPDNSFRVLISQLLSDCLYECCQLKITSGIVNNSLKSMERSLPFLKWLGKKHNLTLNTGKVNLLLRASRNLAGFIAPRSSVWALISPILPKENEVARWEDGQVKAIDLFRGSLEPECFLPDYNLDTGLISGEDDTYPLAVQTRKIL